MIVNLKQEVLVALKEQHLSESDIDFIRGCTLGDRLVYEESVERFLKDADFEYDNDDGTVDIDPTLTIVMKDGSFFTRESDLNNKEYFEYHRAPTKPTLGGVICLAPNILQKKKTRLMELQKVADETLEEIERLKNKEYTFFVN